ncbi:MAG: hypothetical protein WCV41_00455 [Patescibacteria group bacterium]
MQVKYKEKPTKEVIDNYCRKIENFLSAHNISLSIEIFDSSFRIESTVNSILTEVNYLWLEETKVKSPKFGEIKIKLPRLGIDENMSDRELWRDAYSIQNEIYKKLKLNPGHPDDGDPYWTLWEYYPKGEE